MNLIQTFLTFVIYLYLDIKCDFIQSYVIQIFVFTTY